MQDYKLWCTYHDKNIPKEYNLYETDNFKPYNNDVKTLSEDNINYLHDYLCDLTTYYYVWKNNIKSDIVGFCHYSKYPKYIDYKRLDKFGFDAYASTYFSSDELISDDRLLHNGLFYFYYNAIFYLKTKYNINLFQYIKKHPYMLKCWHNIYFFKWDVFCDVCDFVFGYLNYILPNELWKIKSNLDLLTKLKGPANIDELYDNRCWFTRMLSIFYEEFIGIYLGIKYTNNIHNEYYENSIYGYNFNKYFICCTEYFDDINYLELWLKRNIKSGINKYVLKIYGDIKNLKSRLQDNVGSIMNKYTYDLYLCNSNEEFDKYKQELSYYDLCPIYLTKNEYINCDTSIELHKGNYSIGKINID